MVNKAEVKQMSLTEYKEEHALAGKLAEGIGIGREEGIGIGRLNVLIELVKDGVLSVMEAARRAGMTVSEFETAVGLKK